MKNIAEIANWENKIKSNGTVLTKFYSSWIKIHEAQKLKLLTKNESTAEYNIPVIKKSNKKKLDEESSEDENENSEDESDFELRIKGTETSGKSTKKSTKPNKLNKSKKRKRQDTNNIEDEDLPRENTDIVHDINSNDWN